MRGWGGKGQGAVGVVVVAGCAASAKHARRATNLNLAAIPSQVRNDRQNTLNHLI